MMRFGLLVSIALVAACAGVRPTPSPRVEPSGRLQTLQLRPVYDHYVAAREADILRVEQKAGARLADDYRGFVSSFGVSSFDVRVTYPLPPPCATGPGARATLDVFYGIGAADYDLLETWEILELPAGILPIATDPGGNQIVIAVGGARRGQIFFWDHEDESLCPLASSFEAFLDLLRAEPE